MVQVFLWNDQMTGELIKDDAGTWILGLSPFLMTARRGFVYAPVQSDWFCMTKQKTPVILLCKYYMYFKMSEL